MRQQGAPKSPIEFDVLNSVRSEPRNLFRFGYISDLTSMRRSPEMFYLTKVKFLFFYSYHF